MRVRIFALLAIVLAPGALMAQGTLERIDGEIHIA